MDVTETQYVKNVTAIQNNATHKRVKRTKMNALLITMVVDVTLSKQVSGKISLISSSVC